ncbi:hypothetical protein GCG54_00013023 [Colletotrichum gloeosporioides]|uniref:Uncharacterized protein n=1 Tax=Colletotrichum gloeosporioides TaxID=474922 RepID=A0A8H4FN99_COLGL|nr:uncharacterized protein GCG54_00013023 [Colletotrichum gloeosporioides]KAF3808385.1 hypothetical protein GCG54_00013023 [Colletotrichum gloeosporioides]
MTEQNPQPQGPNRDSAPCELEKKVPASNLTSKGETRSCSSLSVQDGQDAIAEGKLQLNFDPRTFEPPEGSSSNDISQGSKTSVPENSESMGNLVSHTLFSDMAPTSYPRIISEKDCDLRNKPPDNNKSPDNKPPGNKQPDGTTKGRCRRFTA